MNTASVHARQMLEELEEKKALRLAQQHGAHAVEPRLEYTVQDADISVKQQDCETESFDLTPYVEAPQHQFQQPFPASSHSVPGEDGVRQVARLQAKLNQRLGPEYVSARAGPSGGPKVFYLEGWKAIDLANEVFGFNGWSSSIVRFDLDYCDESTSGRFSIGLSAIVRVTLRDGTFHEDVGYGSIDNVAKKGMGMEKAKKEAITDALKRALRNFGRSLGNCLYDKKFCESVSRMKAQPTKYDVDEMKRPEGSGAKPFQHEGEKSAFQSAHKGDSTTRNTEAMRAAAPKGTAERTPAARRVFGDNTPPQTRHGEEEDLVSFPERVATVSCDFSAVPKATSPQKSCPVNAADSSHGSDSTRHNFSRETDAKTERLRQAAERKAALQRKGVTEGGNLEGAATTSLPDALQHGAPPQAFVDDDCYSGELADMSASQLNSLDLHEQSAFKVEQQPHTRQWSSREQVSTASPSRISNHHPSSHTYHDTRAKRTRY